MKYLRSAAMDEIQSNRYMVRSIVRAAEVLMAFENPGEVLHLRDVVSRTGLDRATAFRLLHTLSACGFLEKQGSNQYGAPIQLRKPMKYRIGFASGGDQSLFNKEITQGLMRAAEECNVDIVVADNRFSRKHALRAIESLVKEGVDLIIEYQTDYSVAPIVAQKCAAANIPLIAVEVPHPGAMYFGANNYEAGLIGGRHLGVWAKARWNGNVDEIILMEQHRAGPLPQARLAGSLAGLAESLPQSQHWPVVHLDGDDDLGKSLSVVRRHLRYTKSKRILVSALGDMGALGALQAFEEAGRLECCAIMGQNAAPEARRELRRPGTRLIGSVAYFPEKYGPALLRIALDLLTKKKLPPAIFIKHSLITPQNVDRFYPNDGLLGYA
jgi:ribose transport system substrate-binding protein